MSSLNPKHRILLAFVLLLTFGGGFGAGQIVRIGAFASSSLEATPAYQAFLETWDIVHRDYVLADEIDDDALIYGATQGMVDALGDTGHSSFMDPEDVATLDPYLTGTYVGIGVEFDFDGRSLTVISAFDGSPADRAGLLPGDRIVTVDGREVDRVKESELYTLLRGEAGSSVILEVARDGEATFEVTIIREEIVIDPVQWWMLPGNIAHIRLVEFSEESGREFRAAVEAAVEAGVYGSLPLRPPAPPHRTSRAPDPPGAAPRAAPGTDARPSGSARTRRTRGRGGPRRGCGA